MNNPKQAQEKKGQENHQSAIAILGGTFDPIHLGHIHCAKHVAQQLNLTDIHLLPAHIPPHKKSTGANTHHRLAMLKLAIKNEPLFQIDERELNSDNTSFTVQTLKEMAQQHPHRRLIFIIGMDSLLSFTRWHLWQDILTYCHLVVNSRPGYQDAATLKQLSSASTTSSKSTTSTKSTIPATLTETMALLEKHQTTNPDDLRTVAAGKIYITPSVSFDVSSSEIRESLQLSYCKNTNQTSIQQENSKLTQQQALAICDQWLPVAVKEYIEEHQLYCDKNPLN